jgi:tetratricopeptide (TPR) repeat protein
MASKINSRFVIIVAAVVAVIALVCIGGYWWLARKDPGRHIADAERFIAEGEFRRAYRSYGSAFKFEQDTARRVEILGWREEAVRQIKPRSASDAIDWTNALRGLWGQTLILEPSNVEAAEKQLGFLYTLATEISPRVESWDQLYTAASEILRYAPDHATATLYRGIALAVRAERLGLGEAKRAEAITDLDRAAELNPDNGEVVYYRALMHMIEADRERELGDEERAAEHTANAFAHIDGFLETHPGNAEAWWGRVRLLLRGGLNPDDQAKRDQVLAALGKAEAAVASGEDAALAQRVAGALERFATELVTLDDGSKVRSGLIRAEKLMRAVVAKHPDDPMPAIVLGNLLKRRDMLAEAEVVFAEAKKDRPFPIGLQVYTIAFHRSLAMKELAMIHLARLARSTDDEARAESMRLAREQVDELAQFAGENGMSPAVPLMMRGRLALVDGDARRAEQLLSQANSLFGGTQPEVLMLLSEALMRNGESGAAADYLGRALASQDAGVNAEIYIRLARLHLNAQRFDEARKVLQQVLGQQPDNAEARVLLGQVELAASTAGAGPAALVDATANDGGPSGEMLARIDQSLATIQPAVAAGDRSAVVLAARLHLAAQRTDAARELLDAYVKANPADAGVLQQLVAIERDLGNDKRVEELINRARATDPDNPQWDVISSTEPGEADEAVVELIMQTEDPVDRQLRLHTYYQRTGKQEQADAALAEAVASHPDDLRVLMARLQVALRDKAWDDAEQIVARAEKLDVSDDGVTTNTLWRSRLLESRYTDAVAAEDWDRAAAVVDEVAAMNDGQGLDYAKGDVWRGRLLLSRGKHEEAIRALEAAREALPHSSDVRFQLARARLAMGDLSGAEEDLQESLQLRPQNTVAWLLLHQTHDRLRRHDEALTDLRRALSYAPRNGQIYGVYVDYLGRYGEREYAIRLREQIARNNPTNRGNRLALASMYAQENLYAKAGSLLQALHDEDPKDLNTIVAMANLDLLTDKAEQGKARVRDFVVGMGDEATIQEWLVLARFMRQAADAPAAEAAYRRAITLEAPTTRLATLDLANWYFTTRRYGDAAEQYGAALTTLDPKDDRRVDVERRYAEALLGAGEHAQAETVVSKLIGQDPDNVLNVLLKARTAERAMQIDSSMTEAERQAMNDQIDAAYDRAVSLARTNPLPYVQRARRHFESDIPTIQSQVREDLLRAVELDPSAVEPRQMLASWFARRGDPVNATDELRRLISARPDFRPARIALVQMFLRDDRQSDVEAELADAIARFPNEAVWYQLRARAELMSGDTEDWIADLGRAYQRDNSPGLFVEYGRALLSTGHHVELQALLRERPQELQTSGILQAMRAHALALAGQRNQAINAYRRALDLSVDDPAALDVVASHMRMSLPLEDQLSLLNARVREGEFGVPVLILQVRLAAGQAAQVLTEAKRLLPKVDADTTEATELNRLLAQTEYIAGDYEASRRHYETVLKTQPNDPLSLNNLAYLLAKHLDGEAEALPMAQRAVEQATIRAGVGAVAQRANVLDTLGYVQFKLDDLTAAEQTLRRSIRLQGLSANYAHLAMVLAAQARNGDALEALAKAKELLDDQTGNEVREMIDKLERSLQQAALSAER